MAPKWSDADKSNAGWRPGGGGPVRRGQPAGWLPATGPAANRTRRVQQAGLGAAAVAVAAALVGLALWLRPVRPPVLLVVTADPAADAGRLDAPLDPYGYLGGKRLEDWGRAFAARFPDNLKGQVPTVASIRGEPADEAGLADMAADQAGSAKVVVLYFGLHAAADPDGLFLFAAGGKKLRLKPLFVQLHQKLAGKQVVVVLDPGRLPPDPALGLLLDDFPRQLAAVDDGEMQANCPNLTVVCGCSAGERGWESEEWQRTALARSLVRGLDGDAKPSAGGMLLSVADLFDYVRDETVRWTGANRPTAQTPFLLGGAAARVRAAAVPLVPVADGPAPVEEPPGDGFDPVPALEPRWAAADGLAARVPSPAVYTPRRWRRYRELLLRYEYVARSGEARAADALRAALEADEKAIADAGVKLGYGLDAALPLRPAAGPAGPSVADRAEAMKRHRREYLSGPSPAALDRFAAAYKELFPRADQQAAARPWFTADLLDDLRRNEAIPPETLAPRADLLRAVWADRPVRPAEAQLLLLLDQFYSTLLPGKLPAGPGGRPVWLAVLAARREAEEAAVGRPADGRHPYAEWAWPHVRAGVQAGDADRRRAEDWLFAGAKDSTEPAGPAVPLLDGAKKNYDAAAARGREVRDALAARDRALADLPFLARWLATDLPAGDDPPFQKLVGALNAAHALAEALDRDPPAPPADLARAAAGLVKDCDDLVAGYADKMKTQSAELTQASWWLRERLLDVPPLSGGAADPSRRAEFVRANRKTTGTLNAGQGVPSKAAAGVPADEVARRLARAGVAELGREIADRQSQLGKVSLGHAALQLDADKVAGEDTPKQAAAVGQRLADHFRELARPAAKVPDPGTDDATRAERFARVAVGFAPADGPEPAQANRDWRWRRLLAGLAHRAALDHYYNPDQTPYHRAVADALLKDADALDPLRPPAGPAPGRDLTKLLPPGDADELAALRAAPPLALTGPPADPPIRWTSEPLKVIAFDIPAGMRPPAARPAVWAAAADLPDKVALADGARWPDAADDKAAVPVPVTLDGTAAPAEADAAVALTRTAYLRGRVAVAPAAVRLTRSPDLVVTDAPPPAGDRPKVAFRGPDDLDLGAVAVVVDYSGRMGRLADGSRSRINRALDVLGEVLLTFPNGTDLTVRGFGVEGTAAPRPFETFPPARRTGDAVCLRRVVSWHNDKDALAPVMQTLRAVRQDESGFSPVVRAMLNAARDLPAGTDRPKLMIVLTGGNDDSLATKDNDPPTDGEVGTLQTQLAAGFARSGVSPWVVLLAEGPAADAEAEGVRRVFGKLADLDTPGGVEVVKDVAQLPQRLRELLRPRVVVLPVADGGREVGVRVTLPRDQTDLWADPQPPRRPAPRPADAADPGPDPDPPAAAKYLAQLRLSPRNGDPTVEVAPGDRLLIGLSKAPGGTRFERVVWGRALPKDLRAEAESRLVSVPGFALTSAGRAGGTQTLDALVAVEDTRDETVRPAAGPIQSPRPEFVWWKLDPLGKLQRKAVPVHVWPEYRQPAPAWRVRRWDWRGDRNAYPGAALKVWVADKDPPRIGDPKPLTAGANTWTGLTADGRRWRATASWEETHEFVPHPDPAVAPPVTRTPVLAVRAAFEDGQRADLPVFARVAGGAVKGQMVQEHRYYFAAGAYTGYFAGPGLTPGAAEAAGVEVTIHSVADAAGPAAPPGFEFKLPSPDPFAGGGRGLPQPVP